MKSRGLSLLLLPLLLLLTRVAHAECSGAEPCEKAVRCADGPCSTTTSEGDRQEGQEERERFFDEDAPRTRKIKKRIGNPALMVGGIVLASAAPVVFAVGVATAPRCSNAPCGLGTRVATFGLVSLGLVGAAIPMIIIGAKRVPARTVAVGALLGRDIAGVQLLLW